MGGFMNEACPYFDRGFCHKGAECRWINMHFVQAFKQQQLCPNYQAGFCPYGPSCKFKHLQCVIIDDDTSLKQIANFPDSENWAQIPQPGSQGFQGRQQYGRQQHHKPTICHNCGVAGHRSTFCQEERLEQSKLDEIISNTKFGGNERVLCFNCSEHGHYASLCPKRKERIMKDYMDQNQGGEMYGDFDYHGQQEFQGLGKRAQTGLSKNIDDYLQQTKKGSNDKQGNQKNSKTFILPN